MTNKSTVSKTKVAILQRTIRNKGGNILIRVMGIEGCPVRRGMNIVEMLYLYSKNESGCVVGFWEIRDRDGDWAAEFREVGDRLTSTEFDDGVLPDALHWGRRIADTIVDFYLNKNAKTN